jgi:hypothetical protein
MRRALFSLFLLLGLAGLPALSVPAVESTELQAIAKGLVSHRALYTLSVARMDPRNYRNGVAGGLSLEFVHACDGYVLNQRFVIETSTEDGAVLTNMVLNSWESLDAQQFRFKMKDEVNGDLEPHRRRGAFHAARGYRSDAAGRDDVSHRPYGAAAGAGAYRRQLAAGVGL